MLRYDLHLHSCLSPCADNNMTPATIAGMAKLAGLDVIAVTDHNSAENLPFLETACKEYQIKMIAGIEATTAEEIHVLCYMPSVQKALELSDILYESLPNIPCDKQVYGDQLICDCEDNVVGEKKKLLTNATGFDIYRLFELVKKLGGVAVPAHIDKDSYSVLSVLGIMPQELNFEAVELKNPQKLDILISRGQLLMPEEVLSSSDAHMLEDIAKKQSYLDEKSCVYRLIK